MDRVSQEVTPLGTIDYTYDNVGRRKTMTVLGQPVVNYDYYDNGWLGNVRQVVNAVEQKFNFTYDNGGRRERLKYFNGASLGAQTIYGFDNANRLLNLEHLNPLNQVLESIGYTYDPNGNRTTMNRPSVNLPLPNPVTNTSYNEANQMLSFNDKNITYDNNGNMTSVTNTCGTTNYTWDVRNRLVGISGFNTDCSSLTASFKYDVLGRRIEKTINGTTTQYVYDGLDIIQEKQNGTVIANYIRTLNIDEPLARIKVDGTVRYYQMDALGSVIALTDENGVIKTQYSYDPFGNVTISGEASDNPFQYTGRENDGTGLLYERARYDSLELNRYISEDPIGFAGGDVNFYVRVGNNPVTLIDPSGLFTPNHHFRITFWAARDSGYGIIDSVKMAWNVMAEDRNAFDYSASATAVHAMRGELSPGEYQSVRDAMNTTNNVIMNGSLSSALHAGQDLPRHNFESMEGFGGWAAFKHFLNDAFPSQSIRNQAYQNTMNILKNRCK